MLTHFQYMRAEFEVPEGKGYVLGDLKVNKKPLQYGGQLAGAALLVCFHEMVP